ncbi:MAG: hypothetical protein NWF04_06220 [Candidatus Bathyarchaeota archaeon]|nr:hypothetical protein [Candidatus Bathyarchaeota archaeon]
MRLNELASVLLSDVRDVVNVGVGDVSDVKLEKMIRRAQVTLGLELGREVDAADCTEAEKEFIVLLSAVYVVCFLTGGSAAGLNFSVGGQNVSVAGQAPPLSILQEEIGRILCALKQPKVGSA